ncbi:MAG TPA: hypothetical protein VHY91_25360 [Pirellulales bacterium]|jgi:hypothetical protein|nr:hypothetical protein [Pirellulales bacterium]HEX4146851.1 hypothetical protein [Pirellulales bacterium]
MDLRASVAACLLLSLCGCTHVQLQKNAVREAGSVGYLHRQQVLNNLAMFAYDYHALPYFSYPINNAANVTDQGSASLTPAFGRPTGSGPVGIIGNFLFNSLGMSFTGQRTAQEGFVVMPVNDPRKLELMRCAYQQVLGNCGRGPMPTNCPDCRTRFNVFYTGQQLYGGEEDSDIRQHAQGTITTACLSSSCWLKIGCKKCVPKHCPCEYVGHYCDVYVWVTPEGRDELTKLTLIILDFALHEPPQRLSKQVVYFIDELGLPADRNHAVGQVTANVAINEQPEGLLAITSADEAKMKAEIQARSDDIEQKLADQRYDRSALTNELLQLDRKKAFLEDQLRSDRLKQQFGAGPSPASPFGAVIPLFNQYQNTLSAPGASPVPAP